MRRWSLVGVITLAAACKGVPENDFIVEYEDLFCSGYVLCASEEMLATVGERECHQHLRNSDYPEGPECTYDRVAAEVCLAELAESGCDGVNPIVPESCLQPYDGCRLPRVPPSE